MRALGIINFEGKNVKVRGMDNHRPLAAFSFLGRYRLIDIMISNMTNSGIEHIQVYMNGETRSLIEHLASAQQYNINSKTGRLQLLTKNPLDLDIYNHDINAFLYNLEAIEESNAEYVVIAPSFIVYPLDFRKVWEFHQAQQADITIVYKNVSDAKEHYLLCDTLQVDEQQRVVRRTINDARNKNRDVSLEAYVMKKELFVSLIKQAPNISRVYWLKDIIADNLEHLKVLAYRYKKDCHFICSLADYYQVNMILKDYDTAKELFHKDWPIYTRTNDTAPAYYASSAVVKQSIVANGTVIRGTVENSIIGRQVKVETGAVVKDCVVLPGSYIGKDVHVSYAVIDKKARLENVKDLGGSANNILYIKRKDLI